MKSRKYSDEQLVSAVQTSNSLAEVLRKLEIRDFQYNRNKLKAAIKELRLDLSHFCRRVYSRKITSQAKPWQEVLVDKPGLLRRTPGIRLRRALLEMGRPYICEGCDNPGEWQGKRLMLQVDHKNGVYTNNTPDNLRFLCPNCHVQTSTWGNLKGEFNITGIVSKKKPRGTRRKSFGVPRPHLRKIERPSREELLDLIWTKPTMQIAKDFGVSDQCVAKWAKQYSLKKPPRGYWQKLAAESCKNAAEQ